MANAHWSGPLISACGFRYGTATGSTEVITGAGAFTVPSTLTVKGNATACGTLAVAGTSTLTGNVTCAGTTTSKGNVTACGTLAVTSTSTLTGNTTIKGTTTACGTVTTGTNLTSKGNVTACGTLAVTGNTTLSGTLAVTGAAYPLKYSLTTLNPGTATVAVTNSGRYYLLANTTGAVIVNLPGATAATANTGVIYTFIAKTTGAAGSGAITLNPATADAIIGSIVTGTGTLVQGATANKDVLCASGTVKAGDWITIVGDGADGWYIIGCFGAGWSFES